MFNKRDELLIELDFKKLIILSKEDWLEKIK